MRADEWNDAKEGVRGRLCIDVGAPLQVALLKMKRWAVHHLIVEREGVILGIVSDRDIIEHGLMDNGIQFNPVLTVQEVYKREVTAVKGADDLQLVARTMRAHRTDAVLVKLSGEGYGILTASDMLTFLDHTLKTSEASGSGQNQIPFDVNGMPVIGAESLILATAKEALASPIAQGAMRMMADAGI